MKNIFLFLIFCILSSNIYAEEKESDKNLYDKSMLVLAASGCQLSVMAITSEYKNCTYVRKSFTPPEKSEYIKTIARLSECKMDAQKELKKTFSEVKEAFKNKPVAVNLLKDYFAAVLYQLEEDTPSASRKSKEIWLRFEIEANL